MVGGSGERYTLKIIAKYADACNLFGSAETIKRKLSVLREHCKNVGRDYDSILKTKLGLIVVDNDKEMVEKRIQQISKVMPKEQVGEFLIYGTPEDVLKQIELLEEVGIQYLIVDLEPYRELEALEIFGNNIIKKMSRPEIDIS
jgi:alkanesulfonate monooxygenase SsuD/methylene tetrahydromethanopterin reductase-like flavin-dependent oxidoreductase (luciferase family)